MKEDHRIRVTKLMIRRAFTDLLRQKPLQSITVRELCAAAGISRGTFYAHYRDMYDVLGQMEAEMFTEFQIAMRPLLQGEEGELTPLKITRGIFRCLRDNADLCTVTLGEHGDKAFAVRLLSFGRERVLENYTRFFKGAGAKELDYFYAFVSGGCVALLRKWLSEGMAVDVDELASMAEHMMTHGMGFLAQQGLDNREKVRYDNSKSSPNASKG